METVSQRDKNLFENLFVLEAANNHNGSMEKGLKIIINKQMKIQNFGIFTIYKKILMNSITPIKIQHIKML